MSAIRDKSSFPIRSSNKASEWSTLCDHVFQQFVDDEDPFGFATSFPERSTSNSSGNLFDASESSKQSNRTSDNSPEPCSQLPTKASRPEAKQPKAGAPLGFWTRKLRLLERNASKTEQQQKSLRSTKSQPNFRKVISFQPFPDLPTSMKQPLLLPRQMPDVAATGKTSTQSKVMASMSPSRARSSGASRPPVSAITTGHAQATIRKPRTSPSKISDPSRSRVGLKEETWSDHVELSRPTYQLRIPPPLPFPTSPPISARAPHEKFTAFGSPPRRLRPKISKEDTSPSKDYSHRDRLRTPASTPILNTSSRAGSSCVHHAALARIDGRVTPPQTPHPVSKVDTSEAVLDSSSFLAGNRFASFDFGFPTSPVHEQWSTSPLLVDRTRQPVYYNSDEHMNSTLSLVFDLSARPSADTIGLGISCNPSFIIQHPQPPDVAPITSIPVSHIHPAIQPLSDDASRLPRQRHGLVSISPHPSGPPQTPQRPRHASHSPPPPPASATEPRSRRASSRRTSRQHHRSKSSNSTTRHYSDLGGFVNFTPQDSNRILNGVAPSGSSKTKARRDKEAAEKRHRLSQAAIKAVVEAGGDLEALKQAGFVMDI